MLITNETIAKKFCEFNLPFIYRVHTYPRVERLETFKLLLLVMISTLMICQL